MAGYYILVTFFLLLKKDVRELTGALDVEYRDEVILTEDLGKISDELKEILKNIVESVEKNILFTA